jgi:hypothetical protein
MEIVAVVGILGVVAIVAIVHRTKFSGRVTALDLDLHVRVDPKE